MRKKRETKQRNNRERTETKAEKQDLFHAHADGISAQNAQLLKKQRNSTVFRKKENLKKPEF
jgi:hypothetical protein